MTGNQDWGERLAHASSIVVSDGCEDEEGEAWVGAEYMKDHASSQLPHTLRIVVCDGCTNPLAEAAYVYNRPPTTSSVREATSLEAVGIDTRKIFYSGFETLCGSIRYARGVSQSTQEERGREWYSADVSVTPLSFNIKLAFISSPDAWR